MRNPSVLSAAQNQTILDALQTGKMWFRSTRPQPGPSESHDEPVQSLEADDDIIFEDTIDFTGAAGRPTKDETITVGVRRGLHGANYDNTKPVR